ncbi:MAG: flagellar biosynthesis protein FlhB [Candidatus Gastranaerophilales bacterium]|nr:flagellar biosynthesis protein FlhB [Candidatus Gastranaerophilales bacterium]
MADEQNEKTEEATPKRKQKERDRGHIAKSQDFTTSLMLTFATGLIFIMGSGMQEKISTMLINTFSSLNPKNISNSDAVSILAPYLKHYCEIVVLFFAFLALGAILILRFQTGALFAKEALKPNFKKLTPAAAFKALIEKINIFKPKQMVELVKSLIKTTLVAVMGFKVIMKRKDDLLGLIGADPSTGLQVMSSVIFELLLGLCILLIIIGIIDRQYQNWEYNKSIKMSKQEVKDEWKNIEGDPKVKGRIRSFGMKIIQQKMMSKVKEADVVVVNPTHYAVALKYDPTQNAAPIVVAKGVDFIAFKIREIAKNNNIPIIENKPLARSLYKLVEVDHFIPQELYVAVAEILQFVYSRRNR